MNKVSLFLNSPKPSPLTQILLPNRNISFTLAEKKINESYRVLNIPQNSKQDVVRKAFLDLAKKYHPDSGSPDACIDKFVNIEEAFRVLTKHNTGAAAKKEDVDKIVAEIRHVVPQHRQYLSFEGVGHGTPFQREKQWTQMRAQRAANNVMEHRMSKAMASDKTLMKKGQYSKKHDIKTKYGFERLVEDLIQESISKGEFENLSGKGKPLKTQNRNPYVDFTTHKLNEVLISNGFTPEWIIMSKDIDAEVDQLKKEIRSDRMYLGPYPLTEKDEAKWQRICDSNKGIVKSINSKINTYNLIVPLLNKQKFHVDFNSICDDILKNGLHSVDEKEKANIVERSPKPTTNDSIDIFGVFVTFLVELFTFYKSKK